MSGHEHQHWTDDALIEAIYGLHEVAADALDCESCSVRWDQMKARHASLATQPEVSNEFLASQRRKIYQRIEQPEKRSLKWVPALVAAGLAVAGVFFYQPKPAADLTSTQQRQVSDAQAFADVAEAYNDLYSMDQSFEPSATTPIRGLFVETRAEGGAK